MKINRKKKIVSLSNKDHGTIISLIDINTGEIINLKVTYTAKGFGVQAFKEDVHNEKETDLTVYYEGESSEIPYVGVWKLY